MLKKIIIFSIGFSVIPGAVLFEGVMGELFENHPLYWWIVVLFALSCFVGWMTVKGYKNDDDR